DEEKSEWSMPYPIVDCANERHIFTITNDQGIVLEVDSDTAEAVGLIAYDEDGNMTWPYGKNMMVEVSIGRIPAPEEEPVYLPTWLLERMTFNNGLSVEEAYDQNPDPR